MIRSLTLALVCAAQTALADVPDRLDAAFRGWVDQVGARSAVLNVWHNGKEVSEIAIGTPADTPFDVASLSKSITALCAAVVMREGTLTQYSTSRAVLGYGAQGKALGNFLTHTSGLEPDATQNVMFLWLGRDIDGATRASRRALNRQRQTPAPAKYRYNNENYAVAGQMIAAATGQSYEAACRERVLEPAGADGALVSPRTGAMLPWGGWHMTAADFARVLDWGFGPGGIVGRAPKRWPHMQLPRDARYGMGMFEREAAGGHTFWHFGSWCFPLRHNTGAFAVRWANGWQVVATYDACVSNSEMGALDRALSAVAMP